VNSIGDYLPDLKEEFGWKRKWLEAVGNRRGDGLGDTT
jgi:hypothetical protein